MLIISLDEQGDFEGINSKAGGEQTPLFISGVIFDDKDLPRKYDLEKKRINLYLRAICLETETIFPQDLHSNGHNNANVRKTKQLMGQTLAVFLQKGVLSSIDNEYTKQLASLPIREGTWHIFCYFKFGEGIKKLSVNSTSTLVHDGYASNLYIHMAEEVVSRIIFHNPVVDDVNKIRLDLATRRIVLDEGSDLAREYIKLGYRDDPLHKKDGKTTFVLTNADVYRTALGREMLYSEQNRISIDELGVKPIYYETDEHNYRMSFLYMADIICSMLGYEPDCSSPEHLIAHFTEKADGYTGHHDNLIFAYDDVDLLYKKAWSALEEGDYYTALSYTFRAKKSDSPYAGYYTDVWFSRLKEKMIAKSQSSAFQIAVRKFYLSTLSNTLQQDELIDLYTVFDRMAQNFTCRKTEEQAALYELYDAGTSAFCHIGDSVHADACFQKCKKYAKYAGIERYLRTRNKMVVYLTDCFEFRKALEIAQENVLFQEELLTVSELIYDKQELSKNYGIALSQLGQIQSSLHMAEGEHTFLSALDQMDSEDSSDYFQTASYLLHYYIEMGEKEKYDTLAKNYFGGNSSLSKQLAWLIREGAKGTDARFSMKFALNFYVKGLYCFHLQDLSPELAEKLSDIRTTIRKTGGEMVLEQINNHPWEIIYKYLALIALNAGYTEAAEEYMRQAENVLTYHGFTLDAIVLFGKWEFARAQGSIEVAKEQLGALTELFQANSINLSEHISLEDEETAYQYIKKNIINFMYS